MTSPRTLLKAWNLRAKKKWGQNFLADANVAEAIVRRAGLSKEDTVVEIGAGLGSLTIPLARSVRKVCAIEKDFRLPGLLRAELAVAGVQNVEVIEGDVLRIDFETLLGDSDSRWVVVGNLPYSISTQIIVRLIRHRRRFGRAILMFQKELADRLTAAPGGKDYGRISVVLQYCSHVSRLMDVDAACFFPKPQVDSTVISIAFQNDTGLSERDEGMFFEVVRAAFSKRRKTLKNALSGSGLIQLSGNVTGVLNAAGIDATRRAETLSVEDFVRLSRFLADVADADSLNPV